MSSSPPPSSEIVFLAYDADVYQPHQLDWFSKVVEKDIKFYLGYLLCFIGLILATAPPPPGTHVELYYEANNINYQFARLLCTLVFTLVAILTLYIDIFQGSPAEPGDRKWHLMLDGVGGHFCYLTINILVTWAVYWPLCLLGEFTVYAYPSNVWAQKIHIAMYSCAVFASALGTLLTLLFLKFNWFEPNWRREVLGMYDSRGNKTFRKKVLFTHLNQLPIAVLDVFLLKQGKALQYATPSSAHILGICIAYPVCYIAFTHYNHQFSKVYPYTFMDIVFQTWRGEIGFVLGLIAFCYFVMSIFHFGADGGFYRMLLGSV